LLHKFYLIAWLRGSLKKNTKPNATKPNFSFQAATKATQAAPTLHFIRFLRFIPFASLITFPLNRSFIPAWYLPFPTLPKTKAYGLILLANRKTKQPGYMYAKAQVVFSLVVRKLFFGLKSQHQSAPF
jgi:hypothetical protein